MLKLYLLVWMNTIRHNELLPTKAVRLGRTKAIMMNQPMLSLLQHVSAIGGAFSDEEAPLIRLTEEVAAFVSEKLPEEYDEPARLVTEATSKGP